MKSLFQLGSLIRVFCAAAFITLFSNAVAFAQASTIPRSDTTSSQEPEPDELEPVVIVAPRVRQAAASYTRSVAAPLADRGAAIWREPVCVGIVNLRPDVAQAIVDRVSDWAAYLGIGVASPGCEPNILIAFAENGDATARELVAARPTHFNTGFDGADRGRSALRRFQNSGQLVRWWHVSLPIDPNTGWPIGRPPGEGPIDFAGRQLRRPGEFGLNQSSVSASRLTQMQQDDLKLVVIVAEVEIFDLANTNQIADYLTLVSLGQVNPDLDAKSLDSILRLFSTAREAPETLTAWDQAFLKALYASQQRSQNRASNLSEIARLMGREIQRGGVSAVTQDPAPTAVPR